LQKTIQPSQLLPGCCFFIHVASVLQTKALVSSPVLPLAFAAAYAVLAWQAWQAGAFSLVEAAVRSAQPWPDAVALSAMFQDKSFAALAWMHLLLLDFLTARCGQNQAAYLCSMSNDS
jgi:hypothetical protein